MPRCAIGDCQKGRHAVDNPEVGKCPWPSVRYGDGNCHGIAMVGCFICDCSREFEIDGWRADEEWIARIRDAEERRQEDQWSFEIQPCCTRKEDEYEGHSPAMRPFDRRHGA